MVSLCPESPLPHTARKLLTGNRTVTGMTLRRSSYHTHLLTNPGLGSLSLKPVEDWPTPSASLYVTDFVLWANPSTTVSPQPWVPLSYLTAVVKPEGDRILEQGSHSLHLVGQVSLLVLSGWCIVIEIHKKMFCHLFVYVLFSSHSCTPIKAAFGTCHSPSQLPAFEHATWISFSSLPPPSPFVRLPLSHSAFKTRLKDPLYPLCTVVGQVIRSPSNVASSIWLGSGFLKAVPSLTQFPTQYLIPLIHSVKADQNDAWLSRTCCHEINCIN